MNEPESETVIPSWQDAAERWKAAYDDAKAENAVLKEALAEAKAECDALRWRLSGVS